MLAFSSPVPVRDQYLQVAPGVTASLPIGQGTLAAEYEPRLRFFSSIPEVGETSHFAAARLELPLGSRTLVRLAHRYTRATLETTVVDPGREYFFDLERYTYNESSALARVDVGARMWVEGEGRISWNRFDEQQQAGFFDYDHRALRAGLGYDIANDLRATVSYSYDRLPPSPDRAIVESGAHSVIGALAGTLGPQTQATVQAGFRHQTNPARDRREPLLRRPHPRRLAAARARKRDVRRAGVQPLDRPVGLRHERLLRQQLGRAVAQCSAALRGLVARRRRLAAQRLSERRARARRAAPRRHRRLERRDRPQPGLARLHPRRLPPRSAHLERPGLRRDDVRVRDPAGAGAVRAGADRR